MIAKSIPIVAALLCLVACGDSAEPFPSLAKQESLYDSVREQQFITQHPNLATRNNDDLTLHLPNRSKIQLQNLDYDQCAEKVRANSITDGSEGCPVQYQVVGYWKERSMFLMEIFRYYEEHNFGLINADGSMTEILEYPIFSPNRDRLATTQSGCGYYPDGTIAIFEMQHAAFRPVHVAAFEEENSIIIRSARWDGNERVVFDISDCGDPKSVDVTLVLQRDKRGKWLWSGPMKAREVEVTQ